MSWATFNNSLVFKIEYCSEIIGLFYFMNSNNNNFSKNIILVSIQQFRKRYGLPKSLHLFEVKLFLIKII